MTTFCHGWRRKIGVMTLLMACALMVGWMRSSEKYDFLAIAIGGETYRLGSIKDSLKFIRTNYPSGRGFISWTAGNVAEIQPRNNRCDACRMEYGGFSFTQGIILEGSFDLFAIEIFVFPYWSIVLPLTLLSAWLLLSKPRVAKPKLELPV